MEVVQISSDEFEEWNRFVDESPQGEVFCYSWWLDAACRGDFKILAVRNEGQIEAGLPVAFCHTHGTEEQYFPGTLGVLYRNFVSGSKRTRRSRERRLTRALLDNMPLSEFSQMCTSYEFTDWLPFRWHGLQQTTQYTYLIKYSDCTIDELWKNVARSQRQRIGRARRSGLRVEESNDVGLVYDFTSRTFARQGLRFRRSLDDLQRLDEAVQRFGQRAIFTAVDAGGEIHAVDYWVCRPQSTYGLHSGAEPRLRRHGGQALLAWHAIRYFRCRTRVLNFGGSDIEPIERFVRDFGGMQTPYFSIYNPARVAKVGGIRYHGRQLVHHLRGLLNAIRKRMLG